ncbi:MAG: TrkA family potassium uptake protein [Candidatus Thermoplasmatota archaeon]|nr:TrkA family potassium uptake protein [Candidatus Thermoplasmatota archaeon]
MIIVCGFGSIGRSAVQELLEMGEDCVVIEKDREKTSETVRIIIGDAGREEILKSAGVENARALIAATDSDAANALIVLMAKTINPSLVALAVVKKVASIEKLYKAQADHVVCGSMVGGRLIARSAASPYTGDFIDRITLSRNVEITEVVIPSHSNLEGRAIKDSGIRENAGVNIIGIRREEELMLTPKSGTTLRGRDRLIVLGDTEGIRNVSRMLKEGQL